MANQISNRLSKKTEQERWRINSSSQKRTPFMGADLFFLVISQRYEVGPIILTTNKPFKKWAEIFNNDSTQTSAVLDRLLHYAETVVIEGKSYRMKDQCVEPLT
jgi:DNA replication protein DnaC